MKDEPKVSSGGRLYGVDLLKILSMLMVVILHILGQGGILSAVKPFSLRYEAAWLLEISAYCAVNCFALASGYVMIDLKFKYHRIMSLWLQVVFYAVLISVGFYFCLPGSLDLKFIIQSFFPVGFNRYWYFTAYFPTFFLIPFFNHLLHTLDHQKARRLIITLVLLLSVYPTLVKADLFVTKDGYSFLWISALYLIGAYCKKYAVGINRKARYAVLLYLAAVGVTWLWQYGVPFLTFRISGQAKSFSINLVSYSSPTILLSAVALLIAFSKIQIQKPILQKSILLLSSLSFSVYLIHDHPMLWQYWFKNHFVSYASLSSFLLPLAVIGTAAVIFAVCSLIDLIRHYLFKWCKVDQKCRSILERVSGLAKKTVSKFGLPHP